MNTGIYIITNTINGKCYIGSAVNIKNRWSEHRCLLISGRHHSKHLQSAWNKYGSDAFAFSVLLYCSKADLLMFEQRALDTYKPEYNICKVAGSRLGVAHTDAARARMSKGHIGKLVSADTKAKVSKSLIGNKRGSYTHSDEANTRKSIRQTGSKRSPETRARMSEAQKHRHHLKAIARVNDARKVA